MYLGSFRISAQLFCTILKCLSVCVHACVRVCVYVCMYGCMYVVADPEGGGVRGFNPPFRGCFLLFLLVSI